MNRHDQTLEALQTMREVLILAKGPDANLEVKIEAALLDDAIESILAWRYIAEEFAASLTITQGADKPRIAVDVERFLAAQYTYKQEVDDVQQGI